jgi:hypothetical protein
MQSQIDALEVGPNSIMGEGCKFGPIDASVALAIDWIAVSLWPHRYYLDREWLD